MTDKNAILQIKEQQGLKDAKVIPQKRAGELRYVLVLGSFKNRSEADQLARQIKAKTGIAPWIRRVKDIVAYVA
jgi:septal ring-binding cell division protein DamX